MRVLAIDPGNIRSAYCLIAAESLCPLEYGIEENEALREILRDKLYTKWPTQVVIEMVASYGMPVGEEVFDTVRWIGRFEERCNQICGNYPALVKRMEEKMHICHSSRARDSNIRQALIDRFAQHDKKNGRGTKNNPDWFYGFKKDIWSAYAVGLTYIETKLRKEQQP